MKLLKTKFLIGLEKMKFFRKKIILILTLLIFINSVYAQLADSPSPTLKVNSKHTGLSKYTTDIEKPYLKWKFDTGNGIESSPAIDKDGTIYIGTFTDYFFALNPDGIVKWKFTRKGEHFRSSATIGKDGTIYVTAVSGLNPQFSPHLGKEVDAGTPKLYALNADGTVKWEFVLGGIMSGILYAPAIGKDGTIYMISGGAKMEGAIGGDRFWAINPDGTEKWYFETEDAIYSAAALADDGTIYFGCADGNFYALNPDGTEKWRFNTGPGAKERDDIYDSVPSIGADGTIYIGSYDYNLYAFNPDGTVKWKFKMNEKVEATPSIGSDGTIYAGTYSPGKDKNLYALTPEGKELWHFETGQGVYGTPVIDANGILYFGSYDGYLYSLNPDGIERWKYKTDAGIVMPPAISSDGTVYFGSWDNYLYAITGDEQQAIKEEKIEEKRGPGSGPDPSGQTPQECMKDGRFVGEEECEEIMQKTHGGPPEECIVDGKFVGEDECQKTVKEPERIEQQKTETKKSFFQKIIDFFKEVFGK